MKQPPQLGQWTTGFFCRAFVDLEAWSCAFFCPCIAVGRIANIVDRGETSCEEGCCIYCGIQWITGMGFLYSCMYRKKVRDMFDLPPEPCNDILTDWCCHSCSISQVYRELKNRGLNPTKGYKVIQQTVPQVQIMQK
ncbi:hypothetical protein KP509_19G000200 [Ceratopteris richardii]|uniref:Uncharacterized protein n=1 Tax=Ceratopteris richardii TaxID=49495 RepID=A0A8T2SHG1_CERRI|nr:hypothetical protein KP509_19G000200 [Ceratopteris richardii]